MSLAFLSVAASTLVASTVAVSSAASSGAAASSPAFSSTVASSPTASNLAEQAPQAGYAATLASMVGGLIAVLVLIFVLAYIVRRLNLLPSGSGLIKPLAATSLGQRERVVLVELDGQQYLLGVTSSQVTLIDKLDSPVSVPQESFASRLKLARAAQQSEPGAFTHTSSAPSDALLTVPPNSKRDEARGDKP